jgi:glycosyltransferase involved in cell wall biosynthesis
MRVALVTDGITPYVIGGMQKHSFYLARYFARNKIYVDLVHFNSSELDISKLECFSEEEKPYIKSIVLEFPVNPKFPGHYILSSWQYSKLAYEALLPGLDTYDFIYTKGFTGWKLINEKFKHNITCAPVGVKFHGYEMFQVPPDLKTKLQHYLLRPFVKKLSLRADVVFSYGGKITGIIESLGVPKKNIAEIPSGVEKGMIAQFAAGHDRQVLRFVFMGRSERRKGVPELNEALKKLIHDKVPFQFDFIGPVPTESRILHPHITYHGEIRDFTAIRKILQRSDVLVCPSWSEGFPNVILEAMANGLAIIATDVGAVSAMVSEQNGWLIKPGNTTQLEEALKKAVASYNTLGIKKEQSLKLVNSIFNWDSIFKKLVQSIT